MSELLEKIIGSGAMFPVELEYARDYNGNIIIEDGQPLQGWYVSNGDMGLIEQNLKNIVFTLLGSRFRQEDFGSRVQELLEEPNNRVTSFLGSKFVTEAILQWEPRLEKVRVETISQQTQLEIKLYYRLVNDSNPELNTITFNYEV